MQEFLEGRDFERGRACAAALREIFRRAGEGVAADTAAQSASQSLERALKLCALARRAVDDAHCRTRIDMVRDHAVALFGGEERWRSGDSIGPQALRLQGLKLIRSFERWLGNAETHYLLAGPNQAARSRTV